MRPRIRKLLTNEVITVADTSKYYNVDTSTLRHRIATGALDGVKLAKTWFLDLEDVRAQYRIRRAVTNRNPRY